MQTEDIEQKKLVYLYLINYAKTQPELVILAVNTFVKVSPRRASVVLTSSSSRFVLRCVIILVLLHRTRVTQTL